MIVTTSVDPLLPVILLPVCNFRNSVRSNLVCVATKIRGEYPTIVNTNVRNIRYVHIVFLYSELNYKLDQKFREYKFFF